jgi:two-component system sensor histidine kinase/response regulator
MTEPLHILVADDEPIIRQKVSLMLSDKFCVHQTDRAESTRKALHKDMDATLLDIVFPDGNGIDICREAKARDPHTPIVITSSLESVDAWNQAFQAGADGYLEKRELLALDPRKIVLMIENLVERNHLRKQSEETSRRQRELLSVLSHDVRAPFQALLGTVEQLRQNSISTEAATNVETLHQCVHDQLAFINSLLELLRLESGVTGLRTMNLNVNLPVSQAIQSLKILASKKEIVVDADLQEDIPEIECDIGRMAQLVNNLLNNAIKFTHRGGRIDVTTRSFTLGGTTAGVLIRIQDNGIGISEKDSKKILQRFYRGKEHGTEGETGTGLGLSICKEIVLLHNGKIEVLPAQPKGTVVRVWLPISAHARCNHNSNDAGQTNIHRKHVSASSVF